jgi:hypothetical protein
MKLMPVIIPLFIFVGILLTLINPSFISSIMGENSGFLGYVFVMSIGSMTFMTLFVAYPLGLQFSLHHGSLSLLYQVFWQIGYLKKRKRRFLWIKPISSLNRDAVYGW